MKPIPLGNPESDYHSMSPVGVDTKMCPSVYLTFSPENDPDLPVEGEITFRYKLATTREEHNKDRVCYDLDLIEIASIEDESDEPGDSSAEEAMEKYTKK
jgi:hypothetical protein